MRKVPELRFAGFDGEWEEKKLSDLGKISAGGDVDKKKIKNEGKYPVIANGDSNNGIVGYYDDYYKISEPSVTISARGNIGTAVARNYPFTPVIRLLTFISENNIYFMSEVINRLRIFNESSGVPQLTSPQFGTYKIFITKLSEQEKIGNLFRKLDDLIEIQEGKVAKMEDLKKSMLQKMFPKKDELVPEFRFDGFDGEWKKRKFRDIYKTYESGNRLPKSLLKEGSIPYVLAKTTNNGIYMRIDKDTLDYSGNPMKLFKPNSITFSIDNPEAVFIQNEPFYTSNIMRVFYNENHTKPQTIFYKLQFEKNTRGFDWGIKFSGPVALDSKLFVPFKNNEIDVIEIEKIGNFFKNLDTQIENEEKLLESYKMMKKSLLQKMFV